jgi:MFS family permease
MRAFAGLGLAMASPAGFGIIGVSFTTEPARTMAFAALGVGTPFGASMGQILGGVVATSGG